MKNEFEQIERIENYLLGHLSIEDKQTFEMAMAKDVALQNEVAIQHEVMEGIYRLGVRTSIQTAYQKYRLGRAGRLWGSIILLALGTWFVYDSLTTEAVPEVTAKEAVTEIVTPKPVEVDMEIPNDLLPSVQTYQVNPAKDTVLTIGEDGTKIHIPNHAFKYLNGDTVKTEVTLEYQEFKNAADMAFSKIPMTYHNGEEAFNFNSSGMFSLQGTAKGATIEVAKGLTVDYHLAKQNKDIDFYQLNADSTNWDLVQAIDELPNEAAKNVELIVDKVVLDTPKRRHAQSINIAKPEQQVEEVWLADSSVITVLENNKDVDWIGDAQQINEVNLNIRDVVRRDDGDRARGTMLAPGVDAGHTYPPIIAGLNVNRFGVYNCDQIYRLANRVSIQAIYLDEDGQEIKDGKQISLIDLKYNGAFSFDHRQFTCSATGENVILLFTRSGDLYVLDKKAFKEMEITESGVYTFQMENITKAIKTTAELADFLGLKI